MISAETLKDRISWADEREDADIIAAFASVLCGELQAIPEDDPDRKRKALHAAVCEFYRRAWKSGVISAMGAEMERGVIPHD